MRFDRLHIPAFGPFTNLDLRFPASGGDLQVIYGPNEAGKSSLLRAFRDLLFGIHGQSPDNFLHDYKELRIIGEVSNLAGEKRVFQRRKGNKNTLLDADGHPLPDTALISFLGNVDQAYFSTMFGLGAQELREGAEQLLRGQGDIGEALFSASLGGTPVQRVLAALSEASERFFKGRATASVSIRPGVARYKDLLRQSREAAVNPEIWEKLEEELAAAEAHKTILEKELLEFIRNLEWIARCEDALPTVGRLSEEMRKLDELPEMPALAADFVGRARTARKAADDARAEVLRLTAHIARLETLMADCRISPALLEDADALEGLHRDLSVYRDRRKSLTRLESELAGLEAGLRTGMQNLALTGGFSELETLRLGSAVRLACEEAAAALQRAMEERDKAAEKAEDIRTQIETREAQLKTFPETDLTCLRDALAAAADATDAAKTLSAAESEVNRLRREVSDLHRPLTGAPEDPDETAGLQIPSKSAIRRIGEEMDQIQREIQTETARIQEGKKRIASVQTELSRLERRGPLPSEQALQKAREHRDHGWRLVLSAWKGSKAREEFIPGMTLEEAFPQAMAQADDIADQLRKQAEAIAQAEEKKFQILQSEKQNQETLAAIQTFDSRMKACQAEWERLWQPCGIFPRTPAEMAEWRETWHEFKGLLRQLRSAEESFRRKKNLAQQAEKQLATVLSESVDKGFALLYNKAVRRIRQEEQSSGRRIEITEQLQMLKSQLETVHQNGIRVNRTCLAASENWKSQCLAIGLPPETSPGSGLALLRERAEILTQFDVWEKLSTERQKTVDAIRKYEQAVNDRSDTHGVPGDTTEARVSRLWDALTSARNAQTRCNQLAEQIAEAKSDLTAVQTSYDLALQALETLARHAGLDRDETLEPMLVNLELQNQIQQQINGFRDTLNGLARGQTVDEFIDRIRAEDIETITQRKAVLLGRKNETETALQTIRDTVSELKSRKQTLDAAGDTAAGFRQQAESVAAQLKQDASRFVRLRLAVHYLQAQIERFRKENQGPLLEKSGRVFQCITREAFAGLAAEFNADDVPVLVGLRPDHSVVPVSGMSDGSRDQLYLALRLAALDRYLETHEPMPLILDDLLITFDDERAAAILPELAKLAQRTQIFLFTHHDHLLELCCRNLDEDAFHLHRLNSRGTLALR